MKGAMRALGAAAVMAALILAGACSAPLPVPLPGALGASGPDVPPARTATGRLEIRAASGAVVTVTQGLGGDSASEAQLEAAYQSGFDEGRDSARPGAAGIIADELDCNCDNGPQAAGAASTKEPASYTSGWNHGYNRGYNDGYDGVVGGGAAPEDRSEVYRRGWDNGYTQGYNDGQADAGHPDCSSGKCQPVP